MPLMSIVHIFHVIPDYPFAGFEASEEDAKGDAALTSKESWQLSAGYLRNAPRGSEESLGLTESLARQRRAHLPQMSSAPLAVVIVASSIGSTGRDQRENGP